MRMTPAVDSQLPLAHPRIRMDLQKADSIETSDTIDDDTYQLIRQTMKTKKVIFMDYLQ
jgi:hypothetical protein